MARIKSKNISIRYNREHLHNPNRSNVSLAELTGLSRAYTTTAEPLVDAANPELRAYGNASGIVTVSIVTDWSSENDAYKEMLRLSSFFDANPTGDLLIAMGSTQAMWKAGVESVEMQPEIMPKSVRLTTTVSFILGASVE